MNAAKILKSVLPFVLLALGGLGAKALMARKTTASKKPPEALVATVEYATVTAGSPHARIRATGTVEGDKQVSLSALVSGEVVFVSDKLVPGGRFARGNTLLKVDPRDYELAVAQERSRVQQAELEVTLEAERGATAKREWALLGGGKDESEAPLALRGPQLANTQRALEAARSGLERAQLNLERATLTAPFNAMVLSETVEVGQVLNPGAPIVTLVGTDRFRVKLSVPVEELAHIAIPGINGAAGSSAFVVQDLGAGQRIERTGRVVWTVTADDKLARRAVEVAWQDGATAYVVSGLQSGERIVTTPLSLPIEGAAVKSRPAPAAPAGSGEEG